MITAEQEANLAAANARAKKKQDKENPFVVNVKNGRLMPNTPRLRVHKDYRVLPMSAEKAKETTTAQRLKWVEKSSAFGGPRVVNSLAEQDAFDVGTANADELAVFAMETWGLALDPKKPLKTLRKEVVDRAAAEEQQQAADLT